MNKSQMVLNDSSSNFNVDSFNSAKNFSNYTEYALIDSSMVPNTNQDSTTQIQEQKITPYTTNMAKMIQKGRKRNSRSVSNIETFMR